MFVTKPLCVKLVLVKHLTIILMLFTNTMSEIQTAVSQQFNCCCLLQAKCKRTGPGNYSCHCNSGFIGDGYFCLGSVATV